MEEQQEIMKEINEAISVPIGVFNSYDDDELLNELDELEAKEYEAHILDLEAPRANNQTAKVKAPIQKSPENDLDDLYNEMQL